MSNAAHIRVSVIVPTFNYGAFIADALRSVEAQTMREWECLVIDDASTDDTASVVKAFLERDPRFRYVRMEKNSGVSVARNTGLQGAKGAYIQFLDADDILAPRKLERQTEALESDPRIAVVCSDFIHFTEVPAHLSGGEYKPDERLNGCGEIVIRRLLRGNVVRMNTALVRRSTLEQVGGFRPDFRQVEDLDLWFRLAAANERFDFYDDPDSLSGVRVNPNGLSKDRQGMARAYLPVLMDLWDTGKHSMSLRMQILLRYVDHFFELWIVQGERDLQRTSNAPGFRSRFVICALFTLPFWLLSRPFRDR